MCFAPRRSNSVAGEKTSEIDDVKNVGKILSVDLKLHLQVVRFIDIRARRGIDLKSGIDTPPGKVDAIDHLLTVFGERLLLGTLELEWQPGVVLNSTRDPEAGVHLIAETSANRVALVLRIRKMAAARQ